MKKSLILSASITGFFALALTSCAGGGNDTRLTLRIYNSEDYISEGPDSPDVIAQFHDYVLEKDGVDLNIVYDKFDTNETMLSQLETGSSTYDLVCPSDYMIQKMIGKGMLKPFASGAARTALYAHGNSEENWPDNYGLYASNYLKDQLTAITAKTPEGETVNLSEYARGYMWGTLGLIYNPDFARFGKDSETVKFELSDWNSLWDESYYHTFQIKDSMRDTAAVGLMHAYDSDFKALKKSHDEGALDDKSYNDKMNSLFNNIISDPANPGLEGDDLDQYRKGVAKNLTASLLSLKNNSYGLEVDSGKQDIVAGKSGIGIAWSGDAAWSIQLAENEEGKTLYYSLPTTGANIWFDGWVLGNYSSLNQEYAQKFIDFISSPSIANENMSFIGYTSFVAGDEILDLVRGWYDPRCSAMYASWSVKDPELEKQYWGEEDYLYDDNDDYVYKDGTGEVEKEMTMSDGKSLTVVVDHGEYDMTGSDYSAPKLAGHDEIDTWEKYLALINEGVSEDRQSVWTKRDLTYFFNGTLSEEYGAEDMVFYSDEFESVSGIRDGEETTITVGRAFAAQYPSQEELPFLCVMKDYGSANSYVLNVWEDVKSGSLEPWVVVTISLEVALALGLALYFGIKGSSAKKLRKRRREEKKALRS